MAGQGSDNVGAGPIVAAIHVLLAAQTRKNASVKRAA